ncbi:MAG: glycosyltransferase family 2 protein, partial [Clostridia bacterium]|nr:glycosyltransferase family 2 protein [Clostridia bacterium]
MNKRSTIAEGLEKRITYVVELSEIMDSEKILLFGEYAMCANQTNLFDISVVVPIYNVEEVFLRPCLDSVANQTKSNIEVIMVDDGSTDNSGAIADEYAEKYDHFVCYHIANNGLGHARNFGAEKASGKYLYFIDSDDEIAHDLLEKMMLAAERNGSDLTICAV